jgi:hypothetical protein
MTAPAYVALALALDHRVNRLRRADVVARWQIPFGACRNGQPVQCDDLAPRQSVGETSTHFDCRTNEPEETLDVQVLKPQLWILDALH